MLGFRKKNSKACNNITAFLELIQKRKWRRVKKTLQSQSGAHLCSTVDSTGLSALGAAVGCDAPYDIVKAVYDMNPDAAMQPDDYGSLPLHIGCLNGSHPSVVQLLLSQQNRSSDFASHLDMNKFSPLHYAVDFICAIISDDIRPSQPSQASHVQDSEHARSFPSTLLHINDDLYFDRLIMNSFKTIEILCEHSPESVLQPNVEGDTPVDMIQNKKLRITQEENFKIVDDVYQLLQEIAVRIYRRQKAEWEREPYDTTRMPSPAFSLASEESSVLSS